jgi:hypothetical protein
VYINSDEVTDVKWVKNVAGWSCSDCRLKFGPNENIIEVQTVTQMARTVIKHRLCLPCGEVAMTNALDHLQAVARKAKEVVDVVKDMMAKCKLSVRRREHVFIGRKLQVDR